MASDDGTRADASVVEQSRSGLAHDLPATQPQEQIDSLASTTPVELSHLPSQSQPYNHSSAAAASTDAHTTDSPETMPPLQEGGHVPIPPPIPAEASSQAGEPSRHRAVSEAIGPNVEDNPSAGHKILQSTPEAGPTVLITLMLLSGARHPYKIDQKYLRKRNIVKEGEPDIDPFGISVYTLKELIWRDWRDGTSCNLVVCAHLYTNRGMDRMGSSPNKSRSDSSHLVRQASG